MCWSYETVGTAGGLTKRREDGKVEDSHHNAYFTIWVIEWAGNGRFPVLHSQKNRFFWCGLGF